ncbi:MAG: hypothetical protein LUH14_09615 [Clostridiaceae bacterium]|nr:hypothetical protein [Clostridiaceae bacterium]
MKRMKDFFYIKYNFIYAGITSLICVAVLIILEVYFSGNTAVAYPIELWIDSCSVLDFFFPLIVTLPFTWKLFYERKDGYMRYVAVRTDKSKYVIQKIISGMALVFVMVVVIYYSGLIAAVVFVEPQIMIEDKILYRYVFGEMQAENPLFFGLLWCAWKGFVGSIIAGFGYSVSMVVDNIFVVVLMPFLYCILENFITGTLQIEQYSICTTYILNRLSPYSMKIFYYCIGVVSFVIFGSLIILLLEYKKKKVGYSEKSY